jgi:hypothetical protein
MLVPLSPEHDGSNQREENSVASTPARRRVRRHSECTVTRIDGRGAASALRLRIPMTVRTPIDLRDYGSVLVARRAR